VVALGLAGLGLLGWLGDVVLLWSLGDVEHSLSLELARYLCVWLWLG
jgi:hypothetical protein